MMKGILICLFLCCSFPVFGQDLIARKAPVDKTEMPPLQINTENEDGTIEESNYNPVIIIDNDGEWKWMEEEEPQYKNDSYPIFLQYNYYPSHPQYKIVGYHVYSNDGNLIRAANPCSEFSEFLREEVGEALVLYKAAIDFKNNKYNFKKENIKAQNHVKMVLGLINVSEKDRLKYYDITGASYIKQLRSDHYNDFRVILKSERTSNLSFKITIGDDNWNPIETYSVTYHNKGIFKSAINVQKIALEQIDKSQYKTNNSETNNDMTSHNEISSQKYHKVKKGETISSIARKYGISVDELCSLNRIKKSVRLNSGQILKIQKSIDKLNQQDDNPVTQPNTGQVGTQKETIDKENKPFDYDKVHDVVK